MRDRRENRKYPLKTGEKIKQIGMNFVRSINSATVSNSGNANYSRLFIESIDDTIMFRYSQTELTPMSALKCLMWSAVTSFL